MDMRLRMGPDVVIEIGELVLHGVPERLGPAIAEGVQRELAALVRRRGLPGRPGARDAPPPSPRGGDPSRPRADVELAGGDIHVPASLDPEVIAGAIANAVFARWCSAGAGDAGADRARLSADNGRAVRAEGGPRRTEGAAR